MLSSGKNSEENDKSPAGSNEKDLKMQKTKSDIKKDGKKEIL